MNNKEKSAKVYAATGTLAVLAVLLLVLLNSFLVYPPKDFVPTPPAQIELEEFVDFDDFSALANPGDEIPLANDSDMDVDIEGAGSDGGAPASETVNSHASEALVSDNKSSEVKTPEKPTPSPAEIKAREEAARKKKEQEQINNEVGGAFADSKSAPSPSNSQKANGTAPVGAVSGSSNVGHIGQGWGLPAFGGVESTSTGTVIVEASINADGHVTAVKDIQSVSINGRQYKSAAPAATNRSVITACCNEVKSKHFKRTGTNDGAGTTAYIVFNFK